MNREEVKTQIVKFKEAIAAYENKEDVILYITKDKHLPRVGYINEIDSFKDLVIAQDAITKQSEGNFEGAISKLGLEESEVPRTKIDILGFKPEHWETDIQTRLKELRGEIRYKKLVKGLKVLTKHSSKDDQFALETDGLDGLV